MEFKVGIIGAGRIAGAHIQALSKIENVKIEGVCDVVKEKAEEKARKIGARVYTDYKEMLDREKLDAVWICTPADVHSENVLYCIEKNIPFFLEKPVGINERECDEVAEKLKKEKIINSVGFMLRYDPAVEKLKEIFEKEKLVFAAAEYFWTIPLVDTIKSKEKAGGQIVDQAIHLIDLMRYLISDIKSVYTRRVRGFFPEEKLYTGDDASGTIFEFENGLIGNLICTYALFPEITKYYPPKIRFICKKKLIEYINRGTIRMFEKENYTEKKWDESPMHREDKSFIKDVINGKKRNIRCDYFDALKTLKVALAANKSMEKNKVVEL
ncbi:Gfo/Idh/MocA family oxidoreductase [bacterium]|nr:Gfo/Idh/MocA family oxidoreductase [bacterium]